MCHDNEEWREFEEELTCQFKTDVRNLMNFDMSTQKPQKNFTLIDCLLPKYVVFELKKYRRAVFDSTKDWCKIWRKTDLYFWIW